MEINRGKVFFFLDYPIKNRKRKKNPKEDSRLKDKVREKRKGKKA